MRKRDKFWEYANNLGGRFTCAYCKKEFTGGISRVKSHLSGLTGRDIAVCTSVPDNVQAAAVIALGGGSNKRQKVAGNVETNEVVIVGDNNQAHSTLLQTSIPAIYNKKDKEMVDMKVAQNFFMNNIAFNVIRTPAFIDMCKAIAEYGVGYSLPSYTTLRTKLVMNSRSAVEEYVNAVKASWVLTGCTLMSDIWTDMKGRSYINVVAYSPRGAVFLHSFERSGQRKTGTFLRDLLISVIDEVGPQNVVQVVTDNASNYGLAGDMIMGSYPHIYKTRCAAHGVQLLLKDIYEQVQWIQNIVDAAKAIVDYMYRHTIVLDLMREHTDKELKRYSKTRFASQFLMLQSVLEAEDGLRNLVASVTWRNMSYSKGAAAIKVKDIIQGTDFWREGNEVKLAMEPLVRVLRLADGDGSTAGYLYEAMERSRNTIKQHCAISPDKYLKLWDLFESRRDGNILHEIHAVAAYLNPSLMYDKRVIYDQPEVREGLLFVGEKLLAIEERSEFADQLLIYDGKHPKMFTFLSLSQMRSVHPRVWWEANGGLVPILKRLAMRILSQPCSASACERNWSAFDSCQTKKRNKLKPDKLEDLVYIRVNSMMLSCAIDFEMKDRKAIDLENLGDLSEVINEGVEELESEENGADIDGDDASDTSWLERRLGIGSSSTSQHV